MDNYPGWSFVKCNMTEIGELHIQLAVDLQNIESSFCLKQMVLTILPIKTMMTGK